MNAFLCNKTQKFNLNFFNITTHIGESELFRIVALLNRIQIQYTTIQYNRNTKIYYHIVTDLFSTYKTNQFLSQVFFSLCKLTLAIGLYRICILTKFIYLKWMVTDLSCHYCNGF